jgi:hypothetical protein
MTNKRLKTFLKKNKGITYYSHFDLHYFIKEGRAHILTQAAIDDFTLGTLDSLLNLP